LKRSMESYHTPVLLGEVIDYLHITKGDKYVDATLGYAGHAIEILKRGGIVLGIEADPEILELANKRVKEACLPPNPLVQGYSFKFIHGNFRFIDRILKKEGLNQVSGILYDLGVSSLHYDRFDRGFSFKRSGEPLDMRLDRENQSVKASDLLNVLNKKQLLDMFSPFMKPGKAVVLAEKIIRYRSQKNFEAVADLLAITGDKKSKAKTHPATNVFLALRATVNDELDAISRGEKEWIPLMEEFWRPFEKQLKDKEDNVSSQVALSVEDHEP